MVHVHAPGSLHLRDREVESLDDLRGLKVRAPTRMTNAALEALGATPIGMPVPAVPESLARGVIDGGSEEHTSELQSLMRISYAVFCLNKKTMHVNYTYT